MLSVIRNICVGILRDRLCRVIGGLINDEQGGFREGRGWIDQKEDCRYHQVPS